MGSLNERDVEWTDRNRETGHLRRKQLGEAAGGERLGCSLYELSPGTTAWPYHYHTANEEAVFVLDGHGRLRIAAEAVVENTDTDTDPDASSENRRASNNGPTRTLPLEAGDYVALPADASGGHQITNSSDDLLRYLVVSTMAEPDVTVYPDSDTLGVFVGSPPGGRDPRSLHGYYRIDGDVPYESV